MNNKTKLGLFAVGYLIAGAGLATIKFGATTGGLIEIIIGVIMILSVGSVRKLLK